MTSDEIQILYSTLSTDPSLISTLDIPKLMKALETRGTTGIENKTLASISQEIFDALMSINLSSSRSDEGLYNISNMCNKLSQYRLIDEICDVTFGKYVRWVRMSSPEKLTNGGVVINIKFGNDGAIVMAKCGKNRIIQYKFDDCITFQKLVYEENLMLMLQENEK